jgi:hypothetical protein
MLPTPKSRAVEALAEQSRARPVAIAAKPDAAFSDLAALSAPRPLFRPAPEAEIDLIETASLAPATTPAAAVAAIAPALSAPTSTSAFRKAAMLHGPAAARELRMPEGSLALLPITGPDLDVEDEFDGEDTLLAWALSAPGEGVGMAAPVFVGRTLTDLTAQASRTEPLPPGIDENFDHDRFWPGG